MKFEDDKIVSITQVHCGACGSYKEALIHFQPVPPEKERAYPEAKCGPKTYLFGENKKIRYGRCGKVLRVYCIECGILYNFKELK